MVDNMLSLRNLTVAIVLVVAIPAMADPKPVPKDKAKAALNLAGAARERLKSLPLAVNNLGEAVRQAEEAKKPLVIWVGIGAADKPAVYEKLCKDAHCVKMPEYSGNKEPRVIYQGADGLMYSLSTVELDKPDAIKQIRSGWVNVQNSDFVDGSKIVTRD